MKHYPKARGLMVSWIQAQHERQDLVGELARTLNTSPAAPKVAFREHTWQAWALANGLTAAHVEAVFKEYASVPLDAKRAAYDQYGPRAARAVCPAISGFPAK
jgi:hypothetical protein